MNSNKTRHLCIESYAWYSLEDYIPPLVVIKIGRILHVVNAQTNNYTTIYNPNIKIVW